ncbi:DUF6603 domain-containing protein [Janthinobacterium sp. BJB401]|uniref:DUF6603 domain-containing protein n=1 Tax=Janthinobacterium sp. BJB401 TaxID=2745934 RepID=UPI0015958582|nr:DUF6603 domain-containing protein [Janthinobacterium sp. BJB401]NVI83615.1 hypothetical protein [Janthinobacterium sp. BJB401]
MGSAATFDASQLAPTLLKLGIAIGILRAVQGQANSYELNPDWFQNPMNLTGDNLSTNGATIAELFAELLGEVSASALGLPAQDLGSMGVWNPIPYPGSLTATGFYLVNYAVNPDLVNSDQVFGIGVLHQWDFAAQGVADGVSDIEVSAWGLLPVLKIGQGGMHMVLGNSDFPLNMGVQFAAAGGQNIINSNGLSFNGVKFSAQLDLGAPSVDLSVVVMQLQLPTELVPADRNLSQIAQITPQEWLSTVSTLFVSALQQVLSQDNRASNLLPILGLSPIVPDSAVRLPLLRWDTLLSQAKADASLGAPFVAWFNSLLADEAAFPAWMGAIGALLGVAAPEVAGDGSVAAPFMVPLLSEPAYGALALTMVTQVDALGTRYLLPGLNFRGKGQQLGTAPAHILIQAQLDLAQFSLATTGQLGVSTSFLNLNVGIALASTDAGKPLFAGSVGGEQYSFGSLSGGVSVLQSSTAAMKVVPAFQLVDVSTPNGQYAQIDLTQPGTLVEQAITELYTLVDAALQGVFGLAGGSSYGRQAAILLGVIAPDLEAGVSWPATLAPPFSAAQMVTSFQNPVAAFSTYYSALLQGGTLVDGQLPVYWLLRAAGALFDQTGVTSSVSGKGQAADPWLFTLTEASLPASLLAYVESQAGGANRLTLGLQLSPDISYASLQTLDIGIDVYALSMQFGNGAPVQACIFPGIAAHIALPQTLVTPAVAGAAVSVDGASFSGSWSPYDSWHWNVAVGQPAIIVDGTSMPVGQDMVFSDADSLDELVTKQGQTFAPIVTALSGVAVYRTSNRPGLALNALLGLLPNLGAFVPAGLSWPATMPVMKPDGFSDPVGDVKRQISALLAQADYTKAAMSLLGWAVSDGAPIPAVSGSGSYAAPFAVAVDLPGDLDLAVWTSALGQTLGLGLQRSFSFSALGIDTSTDLLLRFVEVPLTGAAPQSNYLPGLRLQTLLTPQTPVVVPSTDGTVKTLVSMRLGIDMALDQGSLVLQPQVLLTMHSGDETLVYDLDQLTHESSEWVAVFYGLLNVGVGQFVTPLLGNAAIGNAYQVLGLMNLVVPLSRADALAGVDSAGWTAMLADPLNYFIERGIALFQDADSRAQAVALLESIIGITIPALPLPMLQLLHALQLVQDQDSGFAPCLYDWVALAANPAAQLESRFTALMDDPARVAQLSAELCSQIEPVIVGPVQLSVSEGALIQVSLLADALPMWGNFLQISGAMGFDLRSSELSAELGLYCAQVQLEVRSKLAVTVAAAPKAAFAVELCWGDGTQPMPLPLTLYPFDAALFLEQTIALAPNFALSTFFGQVVDAQLLNAYPVARTAMSALGLAFQDSATGLWFTKSPLGLFGDPLGWLLGDAVLGANGQLNIAALARVFSTITVASQASSGVGIKPITGGLCIFGLPYSQQIELVADVAAQTFIITPGLAAGKTLALADGVELRTLAFSLSLGPNFQPGLAGKVSLSGKVAGDTTLVLQAAYDKVFHLSARQLESGQNFQILPFPGWQTLVVEAAQQAAQALLKQLTAVLLDELAAGGAAAFVASLRSASDELQVPQLVQQLIAVSEEGADAVGSAALAWLSARLSSANAPATVQAVAGLLKPYFASIETDAGLLRYKPSASLPVTLVTGVQTLSGTLQVGLWVELNLPTGDSIVLEIAPTGIGIPVLADGTPVSPVKPQLNFQLAILAPLQDGCGPKLSMQFDMLSSKFLLGVDPAGTALAASSYYRELLPTFFGQPDTTQWSQDVVDWLESILLNIVPRYLSILVLNQAAVSKWMEQPLFSSDKGPSAATILLASQLMIQEDKLYMLNSLSALESLTIEQFLARFLRAMLAQQFQLVSIGKTGGIWLGPRSDGSDYFGLRVMVPGLELAAVPYVTLQLGDEDTEWIAKAGGDPDLKGGVSLYVPISTDSPEFRKLLLELVNIGMDFHGKEGQNLVQMSRFSLGAVAPRGLITFDFDKPSRVTSYGGGVMLSDIGISLAPNVAVPGGKANPVAENLLGSGSDASPQSANPVANPGFSVRTSYVNDLYVELFSGDGSEGTQVWFPVQRSFGPLYASQIGVGWEQDKYLLDMLFDGNVTMAGLFIGLDSLSVGVPVKTPLDPSAYSMDLAGIDIQFSGGGVEIAGGFLKQDNPLSYDGYATVKAGSFGLLALGSYALVPLDPARPDGPTAASLFIFVNLNIPLGPTPAFFINGLAAGFGYNRNLRIPDVGDIAEFPLVQGAIDSSVFGSGATPDSALSVLSKVVYPEIGQYWAAGGIQFTSFQMLNSFALLIVKFGREFSIDLIGISSASFPPKAKPANALAYVELGLLVSFRPSDGVVSVRAQLTPNSFVLSKDCQLTGGFAAIVWYDGLYAGDFVITLGGYNPAFSVPENYPVVPRLGFNWPMAMPIGSLNINGGAYFALTPSAIMAGGYLKVLFESGPLRAWFAAGVDFLIQWQPFYFKLEAYITVGAGFETEVAGVKLSLTAQIGARLVLWGPPIAGEVGVDWYVISFTIPFGDSKQAQPGTNPLDWDAFQLSFLPALSIDTAPAGARTAPAALMALAQQAPTPALTQAYAVLKPQVTRGLIGDYPDVGWVIQSPFALTVGTVVPATTLRFAGAAASFSGPAIGIQPMAQVTVTTPLTLTVLGWSVKDQAWEAIDLDARLIDVGMQQSSSPDALWSKNSFDPNGIPQAKSIPGTILGATLQGSQVLLYAPVGPMDMATLAFVTLGPLPLPFAWTPNYPAQAEPLQTDRAEVIASTIMDPLVVLLRNDILAALRLFGQLALEAPNLSVLQHNVGNIFQSPPSIAPLGMDLAPVITASTTMAQAAPRVAAEAPAAVNASRVIGHSRRYRAGATRHALGKGDTALPLMRYRSRAKWVAGLGQFAAKVAGKLHLTLAPGATSIVRLGDDAARSVELRGNLALRLLAFNRYEEPLQLRLADPACGAYHELPAATSELVVIAGDASPDGVAGWYHDSDWTRLNHYYFQADGCLLRPEAAPVLKKPQRGQILASDVLKGNQVRQADGSLGQGWLETLFFEQVSTVAVLVGGSVRPRVQARWTDDPANPAYAGEDDLDPQFVLQAGALQVYVYQVPDCLDGKLGLALLVHGRDTACYRSPASASVQGVFGFCADAATLKSGGLNGLMQCAAGAPADTAPPSCQLQIA